MFKILYVLNLRDRYLNLNLLNLNINYSRNLTCCAHQARTKSFLYSRFFSLTGGEKWLNNMKVIPDQFRMKRDFPVIALPACVVTFSQPFASLPLTWEEDFHGLESSEQITKWWPSTNAISLRENRESHITSFA